MEGANSKNTGNPGVLNRLYTVFFKSNDSANKISLGFGLGVFLGVFPSTGPAAALFLAIFLRLNKASALAGSLLTNTWISIVTFLLAVKTGSRLVGIDWHLVNDQLTANFHKEGWLELFKISSFKILFPLVLGYIVIGLLMGLFAYLAAFLAIKALKKRPSKLRNKLKKSQ